MATYIEACGSGGPETANITLNADGSVTVLIGTQSSGQGHDTAYSQIVSEHLDLDPVRIEIVQGDTDLIATGAGTGGSRSIPVGGSSLSIASGQARRRHPQARFRPPRGRHRRPGDGGRIRQGCRHRPFDHAHRDCPRVAAAGEALNQEHAWTPPAATYPNGTHVCEVEVDPDPGNTEIVNYVVVDDFGRTLNPILLEGQVAGGVVQGIGQALTEHVVHDEDSGQLLSASLQDYTMPRADGVPFIAFDTRNVPCATNEMGVKGTRPAVVNAVVDALQLLTGQTHIDMPMTPERVWRAIHQ